MRNAVCVPFCSAQPTQSRRASARPLAVPRARPELIRFAPAGQRHKIPSASADQKSVAALEGPRRMLPRVELDVLRPAALSAQAPRHVSIIEAYSRRPAQEGTAKVLRANAAKTLRTARPPHSRKSQNPFERHSARPSLRKRQAVPASASQRATSAKHSVQRRSLIRCDHEPGLITYLAKTSRQRQQPFGLTRARAQLTRPEATMRRCSRKPHARLKPSADIRKARAVAPPKPAASHRVSADLAHTPARSYQTSRKSLVVYANPTRGPSKSGRANLASPHTNSEISARAKHQVRR